MDVEVHPMMTQQECNEYQCTTVSADIVADINWRDLRTSDGTQCYIGNQWNSTICYNKVDASEVCIAQPVEYEKSLGITTNNDALTLRFITKTEYGITEGSRVYALESENKYRMYNLLNREIAFDIDLSQVPCGMNAALYFSEMDSDGGVGRSGDLGLAGPSSGNGYCDAQGNRDNKFVNGKSNCKGWMPYTASMGRGYLGVFCSEMDIFEGNSNSNVFTPHVCDTLEYQVCYGDDCKLDKCDKGGCDYNAFRLGAPYAYGAGEKYLINTLNKFTVLTQFITHDGTDTGFLVAIQRVYYQNNNRIELPMVNVTNPNYPGGKINDTFCQAERDAFHEVNVLGTKGGLAQMGRAMAKGMVMVFSIWVDHNTSMLWLDSTFPPYSTNPGAQRGTCPQDSGKPEDLINQSPNAYVTFSNIRTGKIGTTTGRQ